MSTVLTLVLALIAGAGASIATGLLTRPAMKGQAKQAEAAGETALSADARAWAKQFQEDAVAARQEASNARQEAAAARTQAAECEQHMDELEDRFRALLALTRDALRLLRAVDGHMLSRLHIPPELAEELGELPPPKR